MEEWTIFIVFTVLHGKVMKCEEKKNKKHKCAGCKMIKKYNIMSAINILRYEVVQILAEIK